MDYTRGKYTYAELEEKYKRSAKTIRKHFDLLRYAESEKNLKQKEKIHIVFDGVHFGRKFVFLVFRSGKQNIHWGYYGSETISNYESSLKELSTKCSPSSFTIDGKVGVLQLLNRLFPSVPVQYCQFHMVQTILRYTTRSPKTECGRELKELILSLKSSSKEEFTRSFRQLRDRYGSFLKERNESKEFVHKRLRSAFRAIKSKLPYLFTFEDFPHLRIEKTTNSCEGYFAHLKSRVRVHPGISLQRKIQMICELFSQ